MWRPYPLPHPAASLRRKKTKRGFQVITPNPRITSLRFYLLLRSPHVPASFVAAPLLPPYPPRDSPSVLFLALYSSAPLRGGNTITIAISRLDSQLDRSIIICFVSLIRSFMATQMEAYLLFRPARAAGMVVVVAPPPKIAYEEQDEDIGSASDSEDSQATSSRSSAASSSSELADEACSETSSSSSSSADLFEMSALMTQLPIKRGLSKFFDGKSQSFASFAAVGSLEDLAKPARKHLNPSRSCGGGLDAHRDRFLSPRRHCPKAAGVRKAAARAALAVLGGSPRARLVGNALIVS